MDVRDRIRKILEERGLTARGVSLEAGLSDSMLHKFLTGQTRSITVDNLEKLANALGVSLRYLMFGDRQDDNLHYIWDHIPRRQKDHALRVLRTFSDIPGDGTDGL
jgi:transcriptional regulator with XRE-family HTH domain